MKVLNVIIQKAGVIDSVESFVILDETDPIIEQEIVDEAEIMFEEWCRNNGYTYNEEEEEINMRDLIDNGYWESSNYDSISLVWSNVNL